MVDKVHPRNIHNLDELRQRICDACNEISQIIVNASIGQWRSVSVPVLQPIENKLSTIFDCHFLCMKATF